MQQCKRPTALLQNRSPGTWRGLPWRFYGFTKAPFSGCASVANRVSVCVSISTLQGCIFVAVFGKVRETKPGILFFVVCSNKPFSITSPTIAIATDAHPMGIHTPPWLHTSSGLDAGYYISSDTVPWRTAIHQPASIRVCSGDVKKIDPGEDHQKAAQQRNGIDCIWGIKPSVKNKRGA